MITNWDEMSIRVLEQINDIEGTHWTDDEKTIRTTALLTGIDYNEILNMPLSKSAELIAQTAWVKTVPPPAKVKKEYKLGTRVYRLNVKMDEMTVAQYLDYQAISGGDKKEWIGELMAIALIPKGESYNESDHNEIVDEIAENLNVREAFAIANFFTKRFTKLTLRLVERMLWRIKAAKIVAPKQYREPLKAAELQLKLIKEEFQ